MATEQEDLGMMLLELCVIISAKRHGFKASISYMPKLIACARNVAEGEVGDYVRGKIRADDFYKDTVKYNVCVSCGAVHDARGYGIINCCGHFSITGLWELFNDMQYFYQAPGLRVIGPFIAKTLSAGREK